MKKITLYSAATRNGGAYADAGETIAIGDDAGEITADRAKQLVDAGRAVSETAARADAKAAGDE